MWLAEPQTPQEDKKVSSEAHAPLFRPKANQAGRLTERVTAELPSPAVATSQVAYRNFIDDEIFGKMRRDGVPHAALATDLEFLRRAKLDLTGRIPTPAEVRDFPADPSPNKRERLIEQRVGSPEFVDKWAYFFMDILRANGKMGRGYQLFHSAPNRHRAGRRPSSP